MFLYQFSYMGTHLDHLLETECITEADNLTKYLIMLEIISMANQKNESSLDCIYRDNTSFVSANNETRTYTKGCQRF